MTEQPNNPLHGITLESLLTELVEKYGWDELARRVNINCFKNDPSIKSSLKFLRRTPWARTQVEELYLRLKNSPWHR
ncbi:VF530 family protein [Oceanimonas sp. CHS3-5]|uniref:VF530 family protein n=1 Tax=Oceanimonas sp. CHS3-5 TaxID=3068186 RepID=UPI00273D6BBF|nr:VF530 family protein [Oceanimonas sp. CHS3-5]MDP5290852.1 VF530 family protein [Oceanimonas sp. CHS3-5]